MPPYDMDFGLDLSKLGPEAGGQYLTVAVLVAALTFRAVQMMLFDETMHEDAHALLLVCLIEWNE